MADVLEKLFELLPSRKAFSFFKKHVAGPHHYEVFRSSSPASKHTKIIFLEDEEYIVLRFRRYSFENRITYHGVTVIGVDERGRLWAHRLPWRSEFEDEAVFENPVALKRIIREAMGFHYHAYELDYDLSNIPRTGPAPVSVRIQGDLVAQVVVMSEKTIKETIRKTLLNFIEDTWSWYLYGLVDEFRRKFPELRDEIDYGWVNKPAYRAFREFLNTKVHLLPPHIRYNWWRLWRQICREEGIQPFAKMPDAFKILIMRDILELPEDVVEMWYERLLNFLTKLERRITVRHIFDIWAEGRIQRKSDHIVKITGIPSASISTKHPDVRHPDVFRTIVLRFSYIIPRRSIFTIRDTQLVAMHPEHGTVVIRVPRFTIIRLTYLNVHAQNIRALVRTLQSSSQ